MRRSFVSPFAGSALALALCAGAVGCSSDDTPPGGPGTGATGDPGRVTMHRLNRVEYNNTVRDLLGTSLTPAVDFPADDRGYGFDNIADVLSMSPLQLELYELAAEELAAEAMNLPSPSALLRAEAETLQGSVGAATGDGWNLWSNGEVPLTHVFPATGRYRISAQVWGDQAGAELPHANLLVGGNIAGSFDVASDAATREIITAEVEVPVGSRVVSVEFTNDYYDDVAGTDRNLYVDWIEVEGPLDVTGENPLRERILICDPATGAECVRQILSTFAERAFRRAVMPEEIDRLMTFVDLAQAQGEGVDDGIELALRAILTSPHFLFRVELDPDPASPAPHPLSDWELASRLSYFLWSSMPDEELFAAAREGRLSDPAEIEAQVERMLADPRSEALVSHFAGQWLYTRGLEDHQPDYYAFPDWDEELRASMRAETERFFQEFLQSDLPVSQMLTADFSFIDQRLAEHYGIPAPASDFERVTLQDPNRRGILTQGAVLTVTSFPTRTSAVKRGKWVLTQLLCDEPPPPPPGVEGLKPEPVPTGSLRERLEAHRADPTCASCHALMDPIGFGMESYDGIGTFRTEDNGYPIDASGTLPSGDTFNGVLELSGIIAGDQRFTMCVSEKLFVYALGRGPEEADDPYLEHLTTEFVSRGERLRDLIKLIATSEPFRMRRGEPQGGQP